jgi:hypothetical protein
MSWNKFFISYPSYIFSSVYFIPKSHSLRKSWRLLPCNLFHGEWRVGIFRYLCLMIIGTFKSNKYLFDFQAQTLNRYIYQVTFNITVRVRLSSVFILSITRNCADVFLFGWQHPRSAMLLWHDRQWCC